MLPPDIDELRRRGLSDEAVFSDEDIIEGWNRVWLWLEEFCEQFFERRVLTLTLDGTGDEELYLPIPIVSLDTLINNVTNDSFNASYIVVYNRLIPNDRRSPKIMLSSGSFPEGFQNITVTGTFGYVELDGSPPPALEEAAMKLLVHIALQPLVGSADYDLELSSDRLIKEKTETYFYELSPSGFSSGGPTGIPSIDIILNRFRRSHWNVRGASV